MDGTNFDKYARYNWKHAIDPIKRYVTYFWHCKIKISLRLPFQNIVLAFNNISALKLVICHITFLYLFLLYIFEWIWGRPYSGRTRILLSTLICIRILFSAIHITKYIFMQLISRFSALTSIQKQQKVIYFEIYAHKDSLLTMRLLHLIATQFDYTFLIFFVPVLTNIEMRPLENLCCYSLF